VTIPAGNIRGIEAGEALAFDDDVLEHLVDGMADVNLAIGIGRAIMEDELGLAPACLAKLSVEVEGLPALELLRFPLWQIALHGEVGGGKIQRGFVVGSHGSGLGWFGRPAK